VRETTPAVRLIAAPQVRWDAVEDYLRGVTAETDDGETVSAYAWLNRVAPGGGQRPIASDAELLIEYAGRRCYRSWAAGLNPNVTRVREDTTAYLDNVLSVKHGSVLEHAQFTFDFDQVSRVFTHELVRHRAGVAISQESLRYVRLTDLGFRIPDVLEPWRETVVSIVERLEEVQVELAEGFGIDDDDVPFAYKKEVTSALRRLAPLGLSTGMVWSANVRTLRHVIEQRTAPVAEEEIRFVFDRVARIMQAECPALFADLLPVGENGGIPHWQPRYVKV
jgi:thymidylate synthase (FAD)